MRLGKKLLTLGLGGALALSLAVPCLAASDSGIYSDVSANAWYADAVQYVTDNDLMDGVSEAAFSPNADAARADLAAALYRAAGSPETGASTFTDIPADAWYADAAAWAEESGVMNGTGNRTFSGEAPITREQAVTILWRYADSPETGAGEGFPDEADISGYAAQAVNWSQQTGVIRGYSDGRFDPQGHITRAQIAAILYRYLNLDSPAAPVHTNAFDLENGTVLLNNGMEMPILGIGTFTLTNEQASDSVYWALGDGYHLIDTAAAYGNEVGVGQGIRRAIDEGLVTREDIFVTTKLWPSNYNMEGINAALENLNLDYIDLLLLHQPMGDYIGGYKAMEQAVAEGKVRAIGVSNFSQAQFEEIMEIAAIPPAINQVETHPNNQQNAMIEYLDQYGTVIEAWFPLGGRGHTQELFNNETIAAIAEAHGKSSAQIILRWHLQAGHIAIPGSNNPDHILENISIFDFELSEEEMERMAALDTGAPYFGGFGGQGAADDAADRWGLVID